MPFDGTEFQARRDLPPRPKRNGQLATLLIILLTSGMLLPLSVTTVLNIIRYLHHA